MADNNHFGAAVEALFKGMDHFVTCLLYTS